MARKKYRKKSSSIKNYFKKIWIGFYLLWSMSGGILFSFGLLAVFNKQGSYTPVIIGGGMIMIAILTGKFTTETALALKKR